MDNVSLENPVPQAQAVSVFPEGTGKIVNPEYAKTMAARADIALGKNSPGVETIQNSVLQGDTERYKQLARNHDIMQFEDTKLQMARDIVKQSEGRAPTQDETDAFMGLSLAQSEAGQSQTIIEQNFAKKYVTTAISADLEDDTLNNAMADNPDKAHAALDIAEYGVARNIIAQDKLTEVTDDLAKMGKFDKAWDFAEQMVPFKTTYNFHNLTEAAPAVAWMSGNNLEEQLAYLQTLPPDQFKEQFTKAFDEIRSRNVYDAMAFAQAAIAFSSSDKFWMNAQDVLDTAGALSTPLSKAAKGTTSSIGRLMNKMKGTVAGSVHAPLDVASAAAKAGHTTAAAKATIFSKITDGRVFGAGVKDLKQLEQNLPNILAPNKTWLHNSSLPPVALTRLEELAVARNARMLDFVNKPELIERMTVPELSKAINEASDSLRSTFNHRSHNVVNIVANDAADNIANVHSVTVQFGKSDGAFFETEQKAKRFASNISKQTSDYNIKEYPNGFAVEVTKNIDETSGGLRGLTIRTEDKAADGIQSKFFGYLRSANDQVGQSVRERRSVGVMTEEYMANIAHDLVQPLKAMPRHEVHELEGVIGHAQTIFNPKTGKTGVYYNNASEFEYAFQQSTGKLPTPDQVNGYFTFVDLNDLDLVVRSLDEYKQKARMGIEAFEINLKTGPVKFEGKEVTQLPFGSKDHFSVRVVEDGVVTKKLSSTLHRTADRVIIQKLIDSGQYKILQGAQGAVALGEDTANYIIIKELKRERIPVMSIPRQEGGHQIMKDRHYVKRAEIKPRKDGGTDYHGDTTLYSAASEGEAKAFAADYQELMRLWDTDRTAAIALIRNRMPFTVQDFYADIAKGLDTKAPISAVKSGQTTADVMDFSKKYPYFNNLTTNEHNLTGRVRGRFLGERSDHIIDTVRKEANGVYSTQPSPFIKPMQALGNTVSDTIRTRVMNDYTISSVQNWYKQFSHVLDVTKEEMDVFGSDFIMNPRYKRGANALELQQAENTRSAITNLISNSTDFSKRTAAWKDKIIESVYQRVGARPGKLFGSEWVSDHLLPTVTNLDVYARSFAFHSKLGFFNPIQLFLQASSFTNAVAIGGKSGVKGAAILPAFQAALLKSDVNLVKGIGNKLRVFGWDAEHFTEAVEGYRQSGFHVVGKDVGYLEDMRGHDVTPIKGVKGLGAAKDILTEQGTIFFRNGERIPRMVSYATSYDEWRKLNPKAVFDRRARATVLDRAKLMAGNMSRDSNAKWQRGWPSMATQFFAYQARMAELFIGKRLTGVEKARLFAMNSALYGAPVGAAGVTAIMPWRDYLKEKLVENGIETDGTWAEPVMDGVIASLTDYMTGHKFDVGSRIGPNGITTFYDLWNGDTEIRDVFMGAAGSIVGQTIASAHPFIKGLWSAADLDDQTVYPVTMDDVLGVLRNISTVDNAIKYYNYTKVGAWVSRNGTKLTNVDAFEAWVAATTGIAPDRVGDTFSKIDAIKAIKERKLALSKEWVKTIKKAATQSDASVGEAMRRSVKIEMIANGMSNQEATRVYKQALDEQPLDEAIIEQYNKNVQDYLKRVK